MRKALFRKKGARISPEVEEYIYRRYDDLAVRIHADIARDRGLYNYYAPWLDYMMEKHDFPDHAKKNFSLVITDAENRHIGCSGAVANTLDYYNPLPDNSSQVAGGRHQQLRTLEEKKQANNLFVSSRSSKPKGIISEGTSDSQKQSSRKAESEEARKKVTENPHNRRAWMYSSKDVEQGSLVNHSNSFKVKNSEQVIPENRMNQSLDCRENTVTPQIITVKCYTTGIEKCEIEERESATVKELSLDTVPLKNDVKLFGTHKSDTGASNSTPDDGTHKLRGESVIDSCTCEAGGCTENERFGGGLGCHNMGNAVKIPANEHEISGQPLDLDVSRQQNSYESSYIRSIFCSVL